MAELSEIQVGGKLRLELEVCEVGAHKELDTPGGPRTSVRAAPNQFRRGVWLPDSFIEAAEYIPPPMTSHDARIIEAATDVAKWLRTFGEGNSFGGVLANLDSWVRAKELATQEAPE